MVAKFGVIKKVDDIYVCERQMKLHEYIGRIRQSIKRQTDTYCTSTVENIHKIHH